MGYVEELMWSQRPNNSKITKLVNTAIFKRIK